jgi:predicted TIM-barrel fold metal-dependent hydrolase
MAGTPSSSQPTDAPAAQRRPFPIVDIHAHFPIENTLPSPSFAGTVHPLLAAYAADRMARMNHEWSTEPSEPPARTQAEVDVNTTRWVAELDRHGIERINFVSAHTNEQLSAIVRQHPDRFTGFAHHPLLPGAGAQLRRAVDDLGLSGYKLLAPRTEVPFEDPSVRDVWEFCAERRLPVLIHFGFLGRGGGVVSHPRMSPLSLFEVARTFPEIPFIIPHFGVNTWADVLALAWSLPNIYVDTSGSNQWMRWMPYPLTLEDLFRKAFETMGPDRVLFGTDSSAFPRGFSVRYLQDQLRACYSINLPEADIALVFGGNATRLLRLPA